MADFFAPCRPSLSSRKLQPISRFLFYISIYSNFVSHFPYVTFFLKPLYFFFFVFMSRTREQSLSLFGLVYFKINLF